MHNSTDARRLYDRNTPLIHAVLSRQFPHFKRGTEAYDIAWTAAAIGLWEAAHRFDPQRGRKFSTFAMTWIRGEINHYIREDVRAKRLPTIN